MTPRQIELVQTSFKLLAPRGDEISEIFYNRLFVIAPQARALFPDDMASQREKLIQMLAFVVHRLHTVTEVIRPIENLGIRHSAYGTTAEHYPVVGEALLWTLKEVAGDAFDDELREAWTVAYGTMAQLMIDAASRSAAG